MDQPTDVQFELRLTGEASRPGGVTANEVIQLLRATQDMVIAIAKEDNPSIDQKSLAIYPTAIDKGSFVIPFTSLRPDITIPAFLTARDAIETQNFDRLPEKARNAVISLRTIATNRNATIELRVPGQHPSVLTPATLISAPTVIERTTLYGYVSDVGSKKPRVRLRLLNDSVVTCYVDVELARTIGPYLYSWRGFNGIAHWNVRTLEMEYFEIEEILPFEETPPNQAFAEIREEFGRYFDAIEDPEAFVATLRDDDTEE